MQQPRFRVAVLASSMRSCFECSRTVAALLALALILLSTTANAQQDLQHWSGNVWQRLAQLPIAAPVDDGHLVVVKNLATNKNMQADVYVVAKSAVDLQTLQFLHQHFLLDYDTVLASRHGKRYRTDARGMVHVDMPEDGLCLAMAGDYFGRRHKQPKATYIGANECAVVRAEVIDGQGKPAANVIVGIGPAHNDGQFACGCTDATGRMVARIAKNVLGPEMLLRAAIASTDGAVSIPNSYYDGKPALLQIQLPPTGVVRLSIHDPAGIAREGPRTVGLQFYVDNQPGTHRLVKPTAWVDGKAVFPYVATGTDVQATVWGSASTPYKARAKGPSKAGEQTELIITLGAERLVLTGRLLTAEGQPVPAKQFWVRISGLAKVQTTHGGIDPQGRFALALETEHLDVAATRFEFFPGASTYDESGDVAVAQVTADRIDVGTVDVGDLTLQPQRVMLRGRVVAADGKPIAHANVNAPLTWSPNVVYGHRVETDKDGWFTMHELASTDGTKSKTKDTLPLRIEPSTWPPNVHNVVATIGKLDHLFEIGRNVSLVISIKDQRFAPLLTYQAIPKQGKRVAVLGRPAGTTVAFLDLPAGPYDVVVRLGRHELARVLKVEVPTAGLPTEPDPRLRDITWQTELQTADVRVLSNTGKPLGANAHVATGNKRNASWLVCDANGLLTLPYTDGDHFFFRHAGYRSASVIPATEITEVRLPPRALLKLSLPKGLKLPKDVEVHASSELSVFGVADQKLSWRPAGPNHIRPEAMHQTVLRLTLRDLRGKHIEFHRQTIQLPMSDKPTDVVININQEDALFAADAAANMAKARGR